MLILDDHIDFITLDGEYIINNAKQNFASFSHFENRGKYAGYKFTIVGKTVEDALFLLEKIGSFCAKINIDFKVGTKTLIDKQIPEQSFKLLTIYLNENTNRLQLEDDIIYLLKGYKGYEGIELKYSESIVDGLYFRKDTDEYGNYIPAKMN